MNCILFCFVLTASAGLIQAVVLNVDIEKHPYQAAILFFGIHTGGGAILTKRHVITAPLKFQQAYFYTVRVGSNDAHKGGKLVGVKKIIDHPDYDSETNENDIAIIVLTASLTFGSTIQPVLFKNFNTHELLFPIISATGYNLKREFLYTPLQILKPTLLVSKKRCKKLVTEVTSDKICVISVFNQKCELNRGDPLVLPGYYLVGLASWKRDCSGGIRKPFVYTSTFSRDTQQFIMSVIQEEDY